MVALDIQENKLKRREVLQDDENFRVEIVEWEDRLAIFKAAQENADERRRDLLVNEIAGTEYFYQLATKHPEWRFRAPQILAGGGKWMVREFIKGEELLRRDATLEESEAKLARLATLLAAIDEVEPEIVTNEAHNSAPYSNIRKRFATWSAPPLKTGILSEQNYQAANQLIDDYQPYLGPRHAHGDLSPFKHVFMTTDGELSWIDFEHFSTQKPRYYDLAYAYTRLFTQGEDIRLAGVLLSEFLDKATPAPHQKEQLLAIMTQRAIGMHFDAFNDVAKGVDYRGRARQLLDLCLTRKIDSLVIT